jgi:hypothetical protein
VLVSTTEQATPVPQLVMFCAGASMVWSCAYPGDTVKE